MPEVRILVAGARTSQSVPPNPIAEAPPPTVFTIGASKEDVRRIQGTPTSLTDTKCVYGSSSVYFRNGRVAGWQTAPNYPLKLEMQAPGYINGTHGFFTVGSTKDAVVAVQGTPTRLTETEWGYGLSSVYFRDGRVAGWRVHPTAPLEVKVLPTGPVDVVPVHSAEGSKNDELLVVQGTPTSSAGTQAGFGLSSVMFRNGIHGIFTLGSTKDAVLAVQGTPTLLTETEWGYGPSSVYFSNGRVVGWTTDPSAPLKVDAFRQPAQAGVPVPPQTR